MEPPQLFRARSGQSARESQYSFEDDDEDVDVDLLEEAKNTELPGRLQRIFQSLSSLEAERQRLMTEAVECTGVSEDEAALLLRGCAWDVAVFNEAFFEDADALRSRLGVAEEDVHMSSSEGAPLCSICFCEPGESLMPCQAPELFCRDCWRQYLEQAVQDGRGCLDLRCPSPSCKELVRPSLFASLLPEQLFQRYQRFLTESLVDDSRSKLRWCPGKNCSAAAAEPNGLHEVHCPCGMLWCFSCGNDVHLPVTCDTVRRWEEKNRDEGCDVVWIKANTKLCPKCQNPIEKNGGCMHMTCRKPGGCGHEFCWICMKSWKDHRQCNAVEEEVASKAATKHELLRYAHYFERYLAHHKAEHFAAKGLRQASEAVAELFTKSLGVAVSDVAFMANACDQIRSSRRFLKWTYAHGYFMKCESDAKKKLFEFHQAQLEGTLERLSDIMENTPWGSYMGNEVISFQPFYDLRTRVISLTSVVCDFFSKLQEAMQQENLVSAT